VAIQTEHVSVMTRTRTGQHGDSDLRAQVPLINGVESISVWESSSAGKGFMTELGQSACSCGCGAPSRSALITSAMKSALLLRTGPRSARHAVDQLRIPAGSFTMGDSFGDRNSQDGEVPLHRVTLRSFEIDATTVMNANFAAFVDDTGYRTEAELFGFSEPSSSRMRTNLGAPQRHRGGSA
jgi:formylglycine-generating enzyme required for sulfatase activity